MDQSYTLKLVNDFAPGYDEYIRNCSWIGPEILFQKMQDFILPGQQLLDLGIGTGLSSIPFKNAGLLIYGLDGSEEMLRICRSKQITQDLQWMNLAELAIPYPFQFDHIISYAVFHFLSNLHPLFQKVADSIKPGGIFGFSIDLYNPDFPDNFVETNVNGIFKRKNPDSGLEVFQHSEEYILTLFQQSGFRLLNKSRIMAFKDPETDREVFFNLFISQKVMAI